MSGVGHGSSIDRRIVALAIPALFMLAAEPIYVLVDTAIVGHLGTAPLGGLALAGTVLTTSIAFCNVLSWGTATRVGNLVGAGDRVGTARVSVTVLWLSLLLGVPLAALLMMGARTLPALLGGQGDVLDAATTYLRIGALGVPAVLVAMAGQAVCRGHANMRGPLQIVIAANVANLVLEVIFVYGLGFGIAGSAWGTVIVQWLAGAVFARQLISRARDSGVGWRADRLELLGLGRIAGDLAIRTGALLTTLAAATSVAARLGATALAAHQIAIQLTLFLAFVLDSTAIAAQTLVANALGAGDGPEARFVARRAIRVTLIGSAVLGTLVLLGRNVVPTVFTDDANAIREAATLLAFVAVMQIPAAIAFLLDGVLMGAGDYATVKRSTVAGLIAFAGPAVWVATRSGSGLTVLWWGLAAWITTRAVVNARGYAARHNLW